MPDQRPEESKGSGAKPVTLRQRVHDILEDASYTDATSVLVNATLIFLILTNVLAFAAETVPHLAETYGFYFQVFDLFCVAVFTVEYTLRLWSCVEIPVLQQLKPLRARLRFAGRPLLLIDLIAILPFYLGSLFGIDLLALRALRLFRFLKLAHYSPALYSIGHVISNERHALVTALLVMLTLLLFASTGIYFIERHVQPDVFGSIPAAAWWAIATLTTVGYGDIIPVTPLGKMFGGMIMIFGLGMFALPVAIVAAGFSEETNRREFVVTWGTVARVPLFAELEAGELSKIMARLHSRHYPQGSIIIHVGEQPLGLFLIVAGRVKVFADHGPVILEEGDFFGEMSLIHQHPHRHRVVAETRCRVLILDKADFERFGLREPELMNQIKATEKRRQETAQAVDDPLG